MAKLIIHIIALLSPILLFGQNNLEKTCATRIDSSKVVKIAIKNNVYWTQNWQCPPALKLDTLNCKWTILTHKIEHTNKGDCKYTNGCTAITSATLVIDAITAKKISLKKEKTIYHNYE